jgi:hypothetical protein
MTTHGHLAEVAIRLSFCQRVSTQPRPRTDIGAVWLFVAEGRCEQAEQKLKEIESILNVWRGQWKDIRAKSSSNFADLT